MSERTRNLLSIAAITLMAVLIFGLVATNPSQADRVDSLGSQIMCPVCQGESIANSPSQIARDMMALVEQRVLEGVSDEAIVDEILSSYSGAVLLDPPASGGTLVLWLAPLAALAVGVGIIFWWRRHPGLEAEPEQPETQQSRKRMLIGGLMLAGVFGSIVVVAGFFLQDRAGPATGVANLDTQDLSSVSNETMEGVVAANLDNPQINAMRLALAERYYEIGDYRSAFPHYLAVAESKRASDGESVAALVRLGWMAWDGNGAADAAIGMFDQALAIDATSSTARYLKGQVLWCGANDTEGAAGLFAEVLADGELPDESRARVEADLAAVSQGQACT